MSAGWEDRVTARLDRADELLGAKGDRLPELADVAAAATCALAALTELAAEALKLAVDEAHQ